MTAQCGEGFNWAYNSLGQSPCTIAEYLGGICNGGDFTVPPLNGTEIYTAPVAPFTTPCRCSTVFYSILCACAACQSQDFLTWSEYSLNCTTVYTGPFPDDIPSGTAIPFYAYQNVTAADDFNVTAAKVALGPESVAPSKPTISSSTSMSISPPGTGNSKSAIGPIVGGVVGGVFVLVVVAALAYRFLIRRHRYRALPPTHPLGKAGDPRNRPPMDHVSSSSFSATHTPKFYDPLDPRTFPLSPAASEVHTTRSEPQSIVQALPSLIDVSYSDGRRLEYRGVPEL